MSILETISINKEKEEYIKNLPIEYINKLAHLNEPIPDFINEILSIYTENYEDKRIDYLLFENSQILKLEENYKDDLLNMDEKLAEQKQLSDCMSFVGKNPLLKPIFDLK